MGTYRRVFGQSIWGFGPSYESGMMQRTAVMVDNDEPITLDMNYKLSQGKIAVWLVNPNGKIVYQGEESTTYKGKKSYPGAKGLWSVIIVANSKDQVIQGNISITLLSSEQVTEQPDTFFSDGFKVESLGKHALAKGDGNSFHINA